MLRKTFLALSSIAALSAAATAEAQCNNLAQNPPTCSTLSITGNGAPGTTLTFDIQGPRLRYAFALVADNAGLTTLSTPGFHLELGIETIWFTLPLGFTDLQGNASADINLPQALTPATYHAQGIVFDFVPTTSPSGPAVTLCTSNVEAFSVGSQPN